MGQAAKPYRASGREAICLRNLVLMLECLVDGICTNGLHRATGYHNVALLFPVDMRIDPGRFTRRSHEDIVRTGVRAREKGPTTYWRCSGKTWRSSFCAGGARNR